MRLLLISLLFFTLWGCSSLENDETLTWSVQKLYNEAKSNLNSNNMKTARGYYNKLLARFPFGKYAQQSILDLIQLEYKNKKYDQAVAQANKFIHLYPLSPYADYARYMKGVIAYSRNTSIFDKIIPNNIAHSDQFMLKKAYENFSELVNKNDKSKYSQDAKKRMIFLRNASAEHEIYVAEYYMRRGAFLAAANRGQYVVKHYSRTPAVAFGLAVMVRSYKEMNMPKLAADAQRVLEKNYPNAASKNPRLDHILNGDVRKKKGLFTSFKQELLIK